MTVIVHDDPLAPQVGGVLSVDAHGGAIGVVNMTGPAMGAIVGGMVVTAHGTSCAVYAGNIRSTLSVCDFASS